LANLHSAVKRIRSNERKRVRNRIIQSRSRSAVAIAKAAPEESKEAAIRNAVRELDRAASKGVIHKNNAARRKSRLLRELNAAKKPSIAVKKPSTAVKKPSAAVKKPSTAVKTPAKKKA
jgi:small subunit ribosomal protein S20